MRTLNEMAKKLQEFIVRQQSDAHNQSSTSFTKYNNLKLKVSSKLQFPNVIVCIGISEATFNITDGTKTDGGLGPDEKFVRKWLGNSTTMQLLKELYLSMTELISAEEDQKAAGKIEEGESGDINKDLITKTPKQRREMYDERVEYELEKHGKESDDSFDGSDISLNEFFN